MEDYSGVTAVTMGFARKGTEWVSIKLSAIPLKSIPTLHLSLNGLPFFLCNDQPHAGPLMLFQNFFIS